eukprot:3544757-Pleurochrysis_carterae.AAC.2
MFAYNSTGEGFSSSRSRDIESGLVEAGTPRSSRICRSSAWYIGKTGRTGCSSPVHGTCRPNSAVLRRRTCRSAPAVRHIYSRCLEVEEQCNSRRHLQLLTTPCLEVEFLLVAENNKTNALRVTVDGATFYVAQNKADRAFVPATAPSRADSTRRRPLLR